MLAPHQRNLVREDEGRGCARADGNGAELGVGGQANQHDLGLTQTRVYPTRTVVLIDHGAGQEAKQCTAGATRVGLVGENGRCARLRLPKYVRNTPESFKNQTRFNALGALISFH